MFPIAGGLVVGDEDLSNGCLLAGIKQNTYDVVAMSSVTDTLRSRIMKG